MRQKKTLRESPWPDWKEFYHNTGKFFPNDACVLTTAQNSYYYYFGRKPGYYVRNGYDENRLDAEYFTGSTPITNVKEFRTAIEHNQLVLFR